MSTVRHGQSQNCSKMAAKQQNVLVKEHLIDILLGAGRIGAGQYWRRQKETLWQRQRNR